MPDFINAKKIIEIYHIYQKQVHAICFYLILDFILLPVGINILYYSKTSIDLSKFAVEQPLFYNLYKFIVIITITMKIGELLFKFIKRIALKNNTTKINDFSHGRTGFCSTKEAMEKYIEVDYNNNYLDGMPLRRTCRLYLKLPFTKKKIKWKDYDFLNPNGKQQEKKFNSYLDKGYSEEEAHKKSLNGLKKAKYEKILALKNNNKLFNKFFDVKDIALIDTNPVNSVDVATTRGYKGVALLLPRIDFWTRIKDYEKKPTIFVTDPKGENMEKTINNSIKNGYTPIILNFINVNESNSYNPLERIKKKMLKEISEKNILLDEIKKLKQENRNISNNQLFTILNQKRNSNLINEINILRKNANDVDNLNKKEKKLKHLEKELMKYIAAIPNAHELAEIKQLIFKINNIDKEQQRNEENLKNKDLQIKEISDQINFLTEELKSEEIEEIEEIVESEELKELKSLLEKELEKREGIKYYIDNIDTTYVNYIKELYTLKSNYLELLDFSDMQSAIKMISNVLIPGEDDGEIWVPSAKNIVSSLIYFILELNILMEVPDLEKFNLYAVSVFYKKYFNEYEHEGKKTTTYKRILDSYNKPNHFSLLSNTSAEGRTLSSMKSYIDKLMSKLSEEKMAKFLSSNTFDIDKIVEGENPYIVYMITPFNNSTYDFFITLIIDQLFDAGIEVAFNNESGCMRRKIRLPLDEAGNIPKIPNLIQKYTVCLGLGFSFHITLQGFEQMKEIYGENTLKIILGNSHQQFVLKVPSVEMREYASNACGKTTIITKVVNNTPQLGLTTTNESETQVPIIYEHEINLFPPCKGLVISNGASPLLTSFRASYEYIDKDYIKMKNLMQLEVIDNTHIYSDLEKQIFK